MIFFGKLVEKNNNDLYLKYLNFYLKKEKFLINCIKYFLIN